jgi:hypothetical protein
MPGALRAAMTIVIALAVCSASGTSFGNGDPVVASTAAEPDWAPIYTNFAAVTAAEVTAQLRADGIPFTLADGGRTIMIPLAKYHSERAIVANMEHPRTRARSRYGEVPELVGMSLAEADAHEKARGRITRVASVDGQGQYLQGDLRRNRTNLWLIGDQVVAAEIG